MAPAIVRFSIDGWKTFEELGTRDTAIGIHLVDLPIEDAQAGSTLCFTFRWPAAGHRWEGRDFSLHIEPPSRPEASHIAAGRSSSRRRQTPVEIHG
jgi:glucoamylase